MGSAQEARLDELRKLAAELRSTETKLSGLRAQVGPAVTAARQAGASIASISEATGMKPATLDYYRSREKELERTREPLRRPAAPPMPGISAAQAASLLGVTRKTVHDWADSGRLQTVSVRQGARIHRRVLRHDGSDAPATASAELLAPDDPRVHSSTP